MNPSLYRLMPNILCLGLLICSLEVALVANAAEQSDSSKHQDYLNGGYYLLHHLCGDEAQLPLLLDVKDAPPEIKDFAVRISKTAEESTAALERLQDKDASIKFDQNPLPAIERDVRESIQDEKQHRLLFGATGPEFVRTLLVSQVEASSYALNLAKVLAQGEKDPARIKALQQISAKWSTINQESYRLLAKSAR